MSDNDKSMADNVAESLLLTFGDIELGKPPVKPLTLDDIVLAARRIAPKVIESPWVEADSIYLLNDLGRDVRYPANWDELPLKDKIEWAVDNGMALVIRGVK